MSIIRPASTLAPLIVLAALLIPGFASALTQFENPLGTNDPTTAITLLITAIITFFVGLAAIVALAALIYGGVRLILGAYISESEIAQAKHIILWAIIGLLVIGLATTILAAVRFILGLGPLIP